MLLKTCYNFTDHLTGKPSYRISRHPTKVCVICGRISDIDKNPEFYVSKPVAHLPYFIYEKDLSDKVLTLEEWVADDTLSKFAYKAGETNE